LLLADSLLLDLGIAVVGAGGLLLGLGGGGILGLLAFLNGNDLGREPVDGIPEAGTEEG
jgi:hypothetical protein